MYRLLEKKILSCLAKFTRSVFFRLLLFLHLIDLLEEEIACELTQPI